MQAPAGSARTVLTPREKGSVGALYAAIALSTVVAFVLLLELSQRYTISPAASQSALAFGGLGIFAYVLGLRHGLDADHIAAIDNTTRKLLQEGKRPLTVGTWFSLGHSTVVVGLVVALGLATKVIQSEIPAFRSIGFLVGGIVSGTFLWLIGLLNVLIVLEIYRIFQGLKRGSLDERALEAELSKRGFLNRYFGRLFRVIQRPRQIYPVGVLFGLGFDTATEIVFLALSVPLVASGAIPLYAVLVLPLLFTLGMVLVDTTDAVMMRFAYGWAFLKPIRKIYYNLTITIISVLVAMVIGTVELLVVLAGELHLSGGVWSLLGGLDLTQLGILIVGLFGVSWAVSVGYYRYRRYDELSLPGRPPARTTG